MNEPVANAAARTGMPAVIRRTWNVENLVKYDLGNGAFLYANTTGIAVRVMWDSGDGTVRSVNLTT